MAAPKRYDMDFKKQAVRLAKEIGGKKAAKELNVSPDTLYGWMRKERQYRPRTGDTHPGKCLRTRRGSAAAPGGKQEARKGNQAPQGRERISGGGQRFFRREPSEVKKGERMKFIAQKLSGGKNQRKLSLYCRVLQVSRQGFYDYLQRRNRPWKYGPLAEEMRRILSEDKENDTYGRKRMYEAFRLRNPEGAAGSLPIPSERTVYRIMRELGISHRSRRKPNGITKADRAARKSDDLLCRKFRADAPLKKCITDITEIPVKDGKLYVSAIFDCFDGAVLGLCMQDSMEASLCVQTVERACRAYPGLRGAVLHSDRGSQYTSGPYRKILERHGIRKSMNSDGGRCHDNARCESMWARMKEELLYGRYDTKQMSIEEVKVLVWRYFMSYWNNRRICSFNDGLPPMVRRNLYYAALAQVS